jgi:putative acetyltransferase
VAVFELEGKMSGFASMEADGHLDLMYVQPEHFRQGVASALYQYLEIEAGAQGLPRLFTEASLTAKPFFEKQGFEVTEKQTVERQGILLDNFRMEKYLTLVSS